jgi:sigma-B regulation protein RsbU (phosphoserine phosphatase)
VVADVSGHGFGPGLLMAETRAYLQALALTHGDVGEILTLANRILVEDLDDQFITVFLASVDPCTRSFVYAGAGHEAFLVDAAGKVRKLCSTSLPLGLEKNLIVPCSPVMDLAPGDVLLLLTDGVGEAISRDRTHFGLERTLEVVRANRARSAREIVDALYEAVRDFGDRQPQRDDITIVTLKAQTAA